LLSLFASSYAGFAEPYGCVRAKANSFASPSSLLAVPGRCRSDSVPHTVFIALCPYSRTAPQLHRQCALTGYWRTHSSSHLSTVQSDLPSLSRPSPRVWNITQLTRPSTLPLKSSDLVLSCLLRMFVVRLYLLYDLLGNADLDCYHRLPHIVGWLHS